MLKAARSGAAASSSFASLERSLERTIEFLTKGDPTPETKALLIEARRLRSVVANWRSIPPAPDVHDEMLDRVLHLSTQAGAALHDAPEADPKTEVDESPLGASTEASGIVNDDTEVYSLDFEPRLYSLEDGPASEPAPARPPRAATPPRRGATPADRPIAYAPYPPAEAPGYAAYPPAPDLPYATYPPAPAEISETYAPLEAYRQAEAYPPAEPVYPPAPYPPPPAAYATPTTARRAAHRRSPPPADLEPPVDDAPVAPQTAITVHPVKLPDKLDPHLVMLGDAYSDRADAYRALRRKLAAASNPRVVAITSPGHGEGKTTSAINLALAMREGARGKVLLLEANVRAPGVSKVLGFEPPECFAEQILRHRDDPRLPWVVVEPLPQLHVLAVDPKEKHAPLLDAVAFSGAMDRLKRAGYEYIVVDTPPVIGSFEVNMIADNVDGVLFTAITMKSKKSAIKKAIEQVMPAPVLGAIVLDA